MKLNLIFYCLIFVLFSACSNKEKLTGLRENILIENVEVQSIDKDNIPVVLSDIIENTEYAQSLRTAKHTSDSLKFSKKPNLRWSVKLQYPSIKYRKMVAAPIAADGKIFCIDAGGVVYAISEKTGAVIWKMSTTIVGKDGQIGGALAYHDGKLIVTSSFSECFCLNAKNGSIIWRIKIPASAKGDAITIYDGKCYILCVNSVLLSIDLKKGKLLWSKYGADMNVSYLGSASVGIDNDTLMVAFSSGEIYSLFAHSGRLIWQDIFAIGSLTNVEDSILHPRASPVIDEGIVYLTSPSERIQAMDISNGKILWSHRFGGMQPPMINGNSVFLCDENGELYCFNKINGKLKWKKTISKVDNKNIWHGQIIANNTLLLISEKGVGLYISPKDGSIIKKQDFKTGNMSLNPIIVNSAMYILSDSGVLHKFQ